MSKIVKPDLLGGFRDLLPADAIAFQGIVDQITAVYRRFGFVPLDTPCMERRSVLTGDDPDFDKTIFLTRIARGREDKAVAETDLGEEAAMRFDLTVPLARVVAAYPNLPRPFKRYQLGKVFRGEKPQAGRFREFYQLDFDIIGSKSILADIETVQIMYETMKALGLSRFLIRFNSRKVLNGLAEMLGCGEKASDIFRIIDKADKIGIDGVLTELQRKPANDYDESALALTPEKAEQVRQFMQIKAAKAEEILRLLEEFFGGSTPLGAVGLNELKEIVRNLRLLGIPEENWAVDLSVARGLGYYNGPVFETVLTDLPELGSVFSGGRFDGLTNRFMADSNIPGVGASVGVDRLIVGMRQLGLLTTKETNSQVLVTVFQANLADLSIAAAQTLRQQGINAELYLGDDSMLRAQLAYATKSGIPFVIVIGPDEAVKNMVALKDMAARKQEVLTLEDVCARLKA